MAWTFKIFPSIGIARIGNHPGSSPQDYYIGPEIPGTVIVPPNGYKDSSGRVRAPGRALPHLRLGKRRVHGRDHLRGGRYHVDRRARQHQSGVLPIYGHWRTDRPSTKRVRHRSQFSHDHTRPSHHRRTQRRRRFRHRSFHGNAGAARRNSNRLKRPPSGARWLREFQFSHQRITHVVR